MLYKVLITPLYDEKKLAVSKLNVNNNKTITKNHDYCSKVFINFNQIFAHRNSSVIRQKSEYQNGDSKKVKHAKFFEKQTFLTHWYAHAHVRIRG